VAAVAADETPDAEIRRQVTALRAAALLAEDRFEQARAAIEGLMLGVHDAEADVSVAAVDLLIRAARPRAAEDMLARLLADDRLPARSVDQLLLRASMIMQPRHLLGFLEQLLAVRPDHPLLRAYRVQALAATGDLEQAWRELGRLRAIRPDAPRLLVLAARLQAAMGRTTDARATYQRLIDLGGTAGQLAGEESARLDEAGSESTDSSREKDGP